MKKTIDLSKYKTPEVKFYSGRPRAEAVRQELNLEKEESGIEQYTIIVPQDTDSIHTSFFLGLFGPSIRKCGSRAEFLKKFVFQAPPSVLEDVEDGIIQAFKKTNVLQK